MQPYFLFAFLALATSQCTETGPAFDEQKERASILRLHHQQRSHHFEKDSIAFADQLSDQFISVNRGLISKPDRPATITRYHNYFSSVAFVHWDDVSEPIVRFSEDGSMAYTVVDKMVVVDYRNAEGETIRDSTHFAWTAIYRKYPGGWKIDAVTSTER